MKTNKETNQLEELENANIAACSAYLDAADTFAAAREARASAANACAATSVTLNDAAVLNDACYYRPAGKAALETALEAFRVADSAYYAASDDRYNACESMFTAAKALIKMKGK